MYGASEQGGYMFYSKILYYWECFVLGLSKSTYYPLLEVYKHIQHTHTHAHTHTHTLILTIKFQEPCNPVQ